MTRRLDRAGAHFKSPRRLIQQAGATIHRPGHKGRFRVEPPDSRARALLLSGQRKVRIALLGRRQAIRSANNLTRSRLDTSQSVVCPPYPSGGSFGESSALGERGHVARAVQHADDDHGMRKRPIVNCVGAMKRYAQSGSQLIAPRCREREAPHWVERGFDLSDEPGPVATSSDDRVAR